MNSQPRRAEMGLGGHPTQFASRDFRDPAGSLTIADRPVHELTDAEKRQLAVNPDATWRQLLELAGEQDWWVSTALAKNPASTADILDLVADFDDVNLRAAVATHPNTHHETLATLLRDPRDDVRQIAAAHPALSNDDQIHAAADASVYVQRGLLANPNLTVMAAQALRQSRYLFIREQMAARDNPVTV
jgi:hypothetical protein